MLSAEWKEIPDVAQYKCADWSTHVATIPVSSVEEAQAIADADPSITFFFIVNGYNLVLENTEVTPAIWRCFQHGDAVFFSGQPWWGSAQDLACGYVKVDSNN